MKIILVTNFGRTLIEMVDTMRNYLQWVIGLTIALIVVLMLLRILADALRLNPFGRLYQYAHQPTNEIIFRMRSSQFYHPLKKSLGFEPSMLMVLVALAILWYVVAGVFNNLFFVLQGVGISLINFSNGSIFTAARYLIGSLLLTIFFFLMALMTIIFVNWIFGLFRRPASWAMERLTPLLRVFEFGGMFAGWSFVILWMALYFATAAVMAIFF